MTPSQAIIADANRVVKVTDSKNRVFEIRRMNMETEIRVAKAISSENASKERYLGMINLASCVVSIDGEMISPCRTELHFEALLQRMGGEGFEAVAQGMRDNFMPPETPDVEK